MKGLSLQDLHVGDKASVVKTITEKDVLAYAEVTGDFNPQHIDEEFAKTSIFKARIAHGMLSVGLISRLLGTELPGMGSIYMSQEVKFLAPVYFDDTITATVEVVEIIENRKVKLRTTCTNQNQVLVIDGFAFIKPPKLSI
ncbi:MAG: MaoC family dehydratase [Candidatus Izemoplasmatales bacterium]|jgi:3-hydroxybutyryl-CoA dehydratase|nr:MaoC family dehydratase [Candidatus Izemoplasmatales bacterium]